MPQTVQPLSAKKAVEKAVSAHPGVALQAGSIYAIAASYRGAPLDRSVAHRALKSLIIDGTVSVIGHGRGRRYALASKPRD